ncbi:Pantothenate kinase [Hartmannibacter diazotrophicus]|uniref:Pantothenate kinase n=1 Tax=Hartmannibacter diazotrophicus TaxID=1482074 RepID=A0A2C9DD04_9HYPH|nr:nucleoside/nucleotide kinase family protein [Hartmannibacter diazotrophicus]SON58187.1 Pantothenate kinase [Hartmannibacter diazotrophicus]
MTQQFTRSQLVDLLEDKGRDRRFITAIAGPPAAGKSTTAEWIVRELNAREDGSAALLPMDGYHYDDWVLVPRGLRPRKGSPNTFDVGGLKAMLGRLRENREAEIAVPLFDRAVEIARAGAAVIPASVRHIVVEGNYLLLDQKPWPELAASFDLTVMIEADEDLLRQRLTERWIGFGLTAEERKHKIDENDLPNALTVLRSSRPADIVLGAEDALPGSA